MKCHQCPRQIDPDRQFTRLDAGIRFTGEAHPLARDVNLHDDCLGPWMLVHYPWLVHPYRKPA